MLDWLIIGGGIHGVHLAATLQAEADVPPDQLRIVDPGPALLHSWRRCTANTGMTHLRSPGVHHLDLDPFSLIRYGRRDLTPDPDAFAEPYNRPSLPLFDKHCDRVVETFGLAAQHIHGLATGITAGVDGVRVRLADGTELAARHVLLAMGAAHQPRWPDWAAAARGTDGPIQHVFEPGFTLDPTAAPDRVAVVGGGITGAQVALRLADGQRAVHLLVRHDLRLHQFDSDPGWAGPKFMRGYDAEPDLDRRRALIAEARHRGSMPPDVAERLGAAIEAGHVTVVRGEFTATVDAGVRFDLGDQALAVDAAVLATGFEARRPGGAMVDALIADHDLPCAACGYPVVDSALRWHPRVFVTGPLAELELGPVARNIVGARRSASRIVPLAREARTGGRQAVAS